MTLTMYDSTNPAAIPDSAEMIAIYIDGLYRQVWVNALAAGRFSSTPKRRIACVTTTTRSDTADFERYDLTPADGPVWYRNMVALGETNLWAYANRSNRVAVEDAMWAAGIRELSMWIATLDGTQQVAPYRYPVAAVQYTDTGSVDLSAVFQTFGPGGGTITGGFMAGLTDDQQLHLYRVIGGLYFALGLVVPPLNPPPANPASADDTLDWAHAHSTVLDNLKQEIDALKPSVPPPGTPTPEPTKVAGTFAGKATVLGIEGTADGTFTGTLT